MLSSRVAKDIFQAQCVVYIKRERSRGDGNCLSTMPRLHHLPQKTGIVQYHPLLKALRDLVELTFPGAPDAGLYRP